jgi:carotenoid cleavage dioxygenase-like enzyme
MNSSTYFCWQSWQWQQRLSFSVGRNCADFFGWWLRLGRCWTCHVDDFFSDIGDDAIQSIIGGAIVPLAFEASWAFSGLGWNIERTGLQRFDISVNRGEFFVGMERLSDYSHELPVLPRDMLMKKHKYVYMLGAHPAAFRKIRVETRGQDGDA